MVDELTVTLREMGADVVVISPFYHVDRKGKGDYLAADGIVYTGRNVSVWVGNEKLTLGVHEGTVNGVHLLFLHHSEVFPRCVALRALWAKGGRAAGGRMVWGWWQGLGAGGGS